MPDLYIDPELIELLDALPMADFDAEVVTATREMTAGLFAAYPLSESVGHTDHTIDGDLGVMVRVHRPADLDYPLPCLVWIHGGGFVIGSNLMDGPALDALVLTTELLVVSVDYRLAPETPYPGPLDDCHRALRWVHDNAQELAIDRNRIGVGGQSAGGALAAALTLRCADQHELTPAFQLLDAPMLDDQIRTPSILQQNLKTWTTVSNRYAWSAYLGELHGTDDVPPHAAPARANDLSELPPTLVIVGGADGLRDEAVDYATRLIAAGVPTDLHVVAGATHGVSMFAGTRIADRWQRIVTDWLRARSSSVSGER